MNDKQRRLLIGLAIGIAATMLYVPVNVPYGSARVNRSTLEYQWLFSGFDGKVDILLLLVEWIGLCIITGILYFLCSDKRQ